MSKVAKFAVLEGGDRKAFVSPTYNYVFDKRTGFFARWGETKADDPDYSPFGPELLDLEISSGGDCLGNCPYCYKCNGGDQPTENMTIDEFDRILAKMPPTLTQIAFGIMNISTNPDFFEMMAHARAAGVIPNYTCHGLDVTPEAVQLTSQLCGAVAVSIVDRDSSYDAVKAFTDAGMTQVNIHRVLCEENYEDTLRIVEDIAGDPRLAGLNAIVFLQYKAKGRVPEAFSSISTPDKYRRLMQHCDDIGVGYGFDSCSAPLFFRGIQGHPKQAHFEMLAEPCESGLFSSYINHRGEFYVCSFSEGEDGWTEGIDVLNCDDFLRDVWYDDRVEEWRETIINSSQGCDCPSKHLCRSCPIFDVTSCKRAVE